MANINITLPATDLEGTSATLSKWLVQPEQQVSEGEAIIELETDKVAMEICASHSGRLTRILVQEGDDIEPDEPLGIIDTQAISSDSSIEKIAAVQDKQTCSLPEPVMSEQTLISPAVRCLIDQHQLDINNIQGTGQLGRVTREDIAHYLVDNANEPTENSTSSELIPHVKMRQAIARHVVESLLNKIPHVTSTFEMDMSKIIQHKKIHQLSFQEKNVKLTFTAYFLFAIAKACSKVPKVNAHYHKDSLEVFKDVNIGITTSLNDSGLITPVMPKVQQLSLFGIAEKLNQLTMKSQQSKLTPNDLKHGTFSLSNHGVSGSLFASPIIINPPQVAILGIGKMEKRVVVKQINNTDAMVIKPKCFVSLSIDHRALDAYQTNMFLTHFVDVIEQWHPDKETI